MSTPNPLAAIHVAVNRVAYGDETPPLLAGQRLAITAAIDAYTRGSAFLSRLESSTGTIEIGMAADLAILDADISRSIRDRSEPSGSSAPTSGDGSIHGL